MNIIRDLSIRLENPFMIKIELKNDKKYHLLHHKFFRIKDK